MSPTDLRVGLRPAYPIRYRASFPSVWRALRDDVGDRQILVVADQNVLNSHPRALHGLGAATTIVVRGGESCKSVRSWERLQQAAVEARMDRQGLVVAVGGGSVGDLAGFFAATFLRGVDWCPVATTVLAMADSATGGKTAVNLGRTKNMVGAFHQPRGVYGVVGAVHTTSLRQRRSGLAEIVKSGLIGDAPLFRRLETMVERPVAAWDDDDWLAAVTRAARVKARIVQRDPRERGERALLNFGHTVGHAIEATRRPRPLHGEAVSLGMVAAASISVRTGHLDEATQTRLLELLRRCGLPVRDSRVDVKRVLDAITRDKKSANGQARMVLTEGLGLASFGHQVDRRELRRAVQQLLSDRPL